MADVGLGRLGVFHLAALVLRSQPAQLGSQPSRQYLLLGELQLKKS